MAIHEVTQVLPHNDFTVDVLFMDGKKVQYDVKPLLDKGVFTALKDINVFMNSCKVMNNTLAWDINGNNSSYECLDIDPITIYKSAN